MALAGGCATQRPSASLPDVPELSGVPFFPQTEFDCGPAALATVLGASGHPIEPDELVSQVYTEGLRGSLQVELLAAARRAGRLPIPVGRSLEQLLETVRSGYPVLVLQNLRLPRWPAWHYAVVVGYDAARDRVILRSGDERRLALRTRRFAASWALADHWGFVVVRPGGLPASVESGDYIRAVVESRRALAEPDIEAAYRVAVERWPVEPAVLFPFAGHLFASDRLSEARDTYRRVLAIEPSHVAARNNLANVLMEQGCLEAAAREAAQALAQTTPGSPFHASVVDTVATIDALASRQAAGAMPGAACG